jgi:hypothetical protein
MQGRVVGGIAKVPSKSIEGRHHYLCGRASGNLCQVCVDGTGEISAVNPLPAIFGTCQCEDFILMVRSFY